MQITEGSSNSLIKVFHYRRNLHGFSPSFFFVIPLVRVVMTITYKTWYPDGSVELAREADVIWVTPYQFLFGGELFFYVADLNSLKEALENVRFK